MSPLDIVILVVAIGCALFGITVTVLRKKKGKGCCGDCRTCGGCCHQPETEQKENKQE